MIDSIGRGDVEPFTLSVPDRELEDLLARLDRVRLPEAETVPDATQGIGLQRLTELLHTWRQHDWRAREIQWNAIPHHRARLDGLDIAFWHARSPEPDALPLVLTHGWPGSIFEFESVLRPLTDPVAHGGSARDAFHVVVPALPGFGFTERPREQGWHPGRTARAWADLMTVLGYERFGAHGGDWGAVVSTELARQVPERVTGLHLMMPSASPLPEDRATPTPAERRMLDRRDLHLSDGYGFGRIMATRPQTLGYALLDSPAGLAAWLGEKFDAYADNRPESGGGVSLAKQIDTIALYWLTGTGASSARWYWEAMRWVPRSAEEENALPVTVPTAVSVFPADPWPTAERWARRRYRALHRWNELDRGGHFPGLEQPDLLVSEIRNAFREPR
ncbi:epoxide hydrolase family protein [Amycolatopsis regifaucium]|uniref:Epoxide hydrolase n=1 Tax=Amycolatopsis regifaucium TaxID=546365 RepID=A0A154M3H0_9PSEU|nr:epoxide hydrolase family protein [Amycolatopsis regifaucium]KZB79162.1 epoxide hydrolase [Amycolatopsis regifaucium]OKA07345.1 epoxide hydrolase [Amycolatopsis regifaucium]SFH13783.1 Pimeloyl-ACP methyl ester carboxylesterase [Amycolatopsis regifaucium]